MDLPEFEILEERVNQVIDVILQLRAERDKLKELKLQLEHKLQVLEEKLRESDRRKAIPSDCHREREEIKNRLGKILSALEVLEI